MGWSPTHVSETQWKVVYPSKQSLALEQDQAAGGRDHRRMRGSGALARVILKARNRRLYAELRWQIDKKPHSQHLGEVSASSRAANLAAGWRLAHNLGLTAINSHADDSQATGQ
jgi:hypothetical protein